MTILLRRDARHRVLVGVPALVLAASILSLSLARHGSHAAMPLLLLTAAIWLSLIAMIAIGAMVGPDHGPNPQVPWLFGWVNRLLMVAYSLWLMVVAWPMTQ